MLNFELPLVGEISLRVLHELALACGIENLQPRLQRLLFSLCHSRGSGNPGSRPTPLSLDTRPRFREGMLSNRKYDGLGFVETGNPILERAPAIAGQADSQQ